MATNFRYAEITDLDTYYPDYSTHDAKRQLLGWTLLSSNKYICDDTGLVTQLFMDGAELGAAESSAGAVNSNFKWYYLSTDDRLYLYNDANNPADLVIEGGIDNSTYFNQMLTNASMELNNMLDSRFPTPIPKYTLYDHDTAYTSATPEYDAIIIKATCYICIANILRSSNKHEDADYYFGLVSNIDGSGIVDKLNKGEYKLSSEVDGKDSKGKVSTITKNGTMDIVETGGSYNGEPFDVLRITCTTAGAYGVAKIKVEYYGNDKLFGSEETNITVTGGLQEIIGGWYCRFQGAAMDLSSGPDQWEVQVYSETRKISNKNTGSVQLTRKGYGI